jgi:hypothetical protein
MFLYGMLYGIVWFAGAPSPGHVVLLRCWRTGDVGLRWISYDTGTFLHIINRHFVMNSLPDLDGLEGSPGVVPFLRPGAIT